MDILFVSANSRSEYIDIEREHRTLQRLVAKGDHTLRVLPAAEVLDLRDALSANKRRKEFDILHFCGHASRENGLHLRGEVHRPAYLSSETLKQYLKGSGVKLVVLNACDSETLAISLSEVVPAVIGTTRVIKDIAARCFTRDFYEALKDNPSVNEALGAALENQKPSSSPGYIQAGVNLEITLARNTTSATV